MNICAIAKNEGPYIREWIEFHRLVGVVTFTIYSNNSADDMNDRLLPYVERGIVELIDWPIPNPSQQAAYADYISRNRGPYWTAFIDCDEFLWSPRYDTIEEALPIMDRSTPRSAVGVNWMIFGSGGKVEWEDAPVIERFTWRLKNSDPVNAHIKSIIWMNQDVVPGSDPHFFHVQYGTVNENGDWIAGPFSPHSSELLRINHYSTKSLAEWRTRIQNGKPDRAGIEINEQAWYWDRQAMEVEDRGIQRYLPALKQRLAMA